MNICFVTLPSKDWWENQIFLDKFQVRYNGSSFPRIMSGGCLIHKSGIRAKVREVRLVPCGRDSVCTRWELVVTNFNCPQDKFQEVFYDFLDSLTK